MDRCPKAAMARIDVENKVSSDVFNLPVTHKRSKR